MAGEQQGEEEEALAGAPAGARGAQAEEGEVTWHLYIILFVIICITYIGRDVFSDWMYLPDLILEHIFKFLSYKVSW